MYNDADDAFTYPLIRPGDMFYFRETGFPPGGWGMLSRAEGVNTDVLIEVVDLSVDGRYSIRIERSDFAPRDPDAFSLPIGDAERMLKRGFWVPADLGDRINRDLRRLAGGL
jgi:hypothetical protein